MKSKRNQLSTLPVHFPVTNNTMHCRIFTYMQKDNIRFMDDPGAIPLVAASRGTHIILPNYYCPRNIGMYFLSHATDFLIFLIGFIDAKTPDGRVIFLLPFEGHTIVGTTDAPTELSFSPKPPEEDINVSCHDIRLLSYTTLVYFGSSAVILKPGY